MLEQVDNRVARTRFDIPSGNHILANRSPSKRSKPGELKMKSFKSILCASLLTLALSASAFAGDMTSIKGDTTSIKGDMTSIKGDMTSIKGDMTSIKGDMTSIAGDLTSLLFGILI